MNFGQIISPWWYREKWKIVLSLPLKAFLKKIKGMKKLIKLSLCHTREFCLANFAR
jgi:hypothetical protein